jgi:hypothetical protein
LREYRIDLAKEWKTMSWRKFIVLIKGLSINSSLANHLASVKDKKIITDTKVAEGILAGW